MRSTEMARGRRAAREVRRASCCVVVSVRRAAVALGREGIRRCRKEGLVVGFSRRVSGRAWAVRWVEMRAAMAGRWCGRVV